MAGPLRPECVMSTAPSSRRPRPGNDTSAPGTLIPANSRSQGAARIVAAQVARLEASVGDVATATAGNSNLGKKMRSFLEQRDAHFRGGFRAGDGGKKASRTTAHNDDPPAHGKSLRT